MLGLNNKYLSQKKLDKILSSEPPVYKPSKRELNTKVSFNSYYFELLKTLLSFINCITSGQRLNRKYGIEPDEECITKVMCNIKSTCKKIDESRNTSSSLPELTMADFKSYIFDLKLAYKNIKKEGEAPWFLKPYIDKYINYFKSIQKPIKLS